MDIFFEKSSPADVNEIIKVRNKSFYDDFIKYGEFPGYNCSVQGVTSAILERFVYNIICDGKIIGNISVRDDGNGKFHLNCLCIIPEYANLGIGKKAMTFIESQFATAKHWFLETLVEKKRNLYFYQKHGYIITKEYMEKSIRLAVLEKWINPAV